MSLDNYKVLVTGATGFIGQHVVRQLLKQQCTVVTTSLHAEKAKDVDWYQNVIYLPYDISNAQTLKEGINLFEYFQKPDCVIHLAWVGVTDCNGMFHIEKNLMQHYFFLKTLIEQGVKNVIVAGTCLEYGMKTGPQSEEQLPEPHVAYAIAKDALRRFLNELMKVHLFNLQWVRLFYMYGPGQHERSLIEQLKTAIRRRDKVFNMSGGEQIRDYLCIEDVAKYMVEILKTKSTGLINCCSGNPIKVKDLVLQQIKELKGNIELNCGYYPYKDYEPMSFWGDNGKMVGMLKSNKNNF